MIFELTMTNVITVAALFIAALWALLKVISHQGEKRISERFDALGKVMADIAKTQDRNASATLELEREFRKHQADMAREYLRRDDFVRHVGIIETRIDNFALRMERSLDQLGVKK
ncbi:hypothetical protein BA022_15785 [Diaphorobacter nitroreducens]|uniref:hypothetical protein n=1 Tax=Diaphorobacter nitroreducens TaxID=164759 RepID=UPI000B5A1AFD|nr:hypothetical protein [Diaphorobacter nitroreducens]ASI69880.1 hypothetical protein BA022_15785 [Diaphorobacter nitroreducens]